MQMSGPEEADCFKGSLVWLKPNSIQNVSRNFFTDLHVCDADTTADPAKSEFSICKWMQQLEWLDSAWMTSHCDTKYRSRLN